MGSSLLGDRDQVNATMDSGRSIVTRCYSVPLVEITRRRRIRSQWTSEERSPMAEVVRSALTSTLREPTSERCQRRMCPFRPPHLGIRGSCAGILVHQAAPSSPTASMPPCSPVSMPTQAARHSNSAKPRSTRWCSPKDDRSKEKHRALTLMRWAAANRGVGYRSRNGLISRLPT